MKTALRSIFFEEAGEFGLEGGAADLVAEGNVKIAEVLFDGGRRVRAVEDFLGLEDSQPALPVTVAAVGDLGKDAGEKVLRLGIELGVRRGVGMFEECTGFGHVIEEILRAIGLQLNGESLGLRILAGTHQHVGLQFLITVCSLALAGIL